MEILIPLPQNSSANTYQELRSYLKQFELAIHHAQKSIESAEKEGVEVTEDAFINFNHPHFKSSLEMEAKDPKNSKEEREILSNINDNYYEELQSVELHINLA